MSHIITSHQLIGSATLLASSTEHSLKRTYLAKKLAKLNRLLDAHLNVLDKKLREIEDLTAKIDEASSISVQTPVQKKHLKQMTTLRASTERWVLSSQIMRKINEIRAEIQALSEATLDTHDELA